MTTPRDQTAPYRGHPPYQRHSETSAEAADAVATKAPGLRERALAAFDEAGIRGLTDYELADILGRPLNSAVPRRCELMERKLVKDSGRCRPSPYSPRITVWVRTAKRGEQQELF